MPLVFKKSFQKYGMRRQPGALNFECSCFNLYYWNTAPLARKNRSALVSGSF